MKKYVISLLTVFNFLNANEEWISSISNRTDQEAIEWVKKELERLPQKKAEEIDKNILEKLSKKKCHSLAAAYEDSSASKIFACLSFSVPEMTWISLSKELEKVGGIIVLRGLPNNSFKELSQKVQRMAKIGIKIPIQIHPQLFEKYSVTLVPTIIVTDEEKFDKITGNVTLSFALDQMAEYGEIEKAKKLLNEHNN